MTFTKAEKQEKLRNLQNMLLEANADRFFTVRSRMVADRQDAEFWEAINEATHEEYPDE